MTPPPLGWHCHLFLPFFLYRAPLRWMDGIELWWVSLIGFLSCLAAKQCKSPPILRPSPPRVRKTQEPRNPVHTFFSGKIRKNTQNQEKYSRHLEKYYWEKYAKSGKILKVWKKYSEYPKKYGWDLKKGPHLSLVEEYGKILKYKFWKMFWKSRKYWWDLNKVPT